MVLSTCCSVPRMGTPACFNVIQKARTISTDMLTAVKLCFFARVLNLLAIGAVMPAHLFLMPPVWDGSSGVSKHLAKAALRNA
eukprot:419738-Pyramimonas_sp.AAC.1